MCAPAHVAPFFLVPPLPLQVAHSRLDSGSHYAGHYEARYAGNLEARHDFNFSTYFGA